MITNENPIFAALKKMSLIIVRISLIINKIK